MAVSLIGDTGGIRRAVRRTRRLMGRLLSRGVSAWQRSLQLRVGATTVLVTGAMILIIGLFLVDRVSAGVLRTKRDTAVDQAKLGLVPAARAFEGVNPADSALRRDAEDRFVASLTSSGSSGGQFTVSLESRGSGDVSGAVTIPPALRTQVQRGYLAVQYAQVFERSGSGRLVKGLIVGEPVFVRSGDFELYYLFPLTSEEQTISLIRRTVLLSGLAVLLVVLAIALLVTRQVVRPVRVAAATAGRLAAGDLSERIAVTGRDDIARLGRSFNDMADSLQRQIRRLEDLSRVQRRFTSDVSHELRTPLTTIRMASEMLHEGRGEFSPHIARSAELLQSELDRFEALLTDLLEISRYDAGAARLDSESVDVRQVIAAAVAATRMLAERHGSQVIVVQPDVAVRADIDSRRIERILRNLLGNALDHGDGKPVEITLAHDNSAVAIAVRDHGVGLRPGEAGLVFNRFWRGDPSRSRLTGGTGLGLAISLEDARLHDGWLQAWGARGRGAQFRLTLPRRAGDTLMHSPLPLDPDEPPEDEE